MRILTLTRPSVTSNAERATANLWTLALILLLAVGAASCSDVSNAPAPAPGPVVLAITTTSLPAATVGQAYNATLTGTAGKTPYNWLVTPPLPSGLSLNATAGTISGTPGTTTAGTANYTFVLQDAASSEDTKILTLTINPAPVPLAITTTSLQNGTVNQPYCAFTLAATGGTPPYTWSATPPLPNGLQLNVPTSGTISGTPLSGTAGTTTRTFTVQDSSTPVNQTISKSLTLTITSTVPTLSIATTTLPNGKVGTPYPATTLQGSGGIPCYTWSVSTLPAGLQLNASTGTITGTPTAASNLTYTFTLRDSALPANQTKTAAIGLRITN